MAKIISEQRSVRGFDTIDLRGKGDIILTQGESESLTLEGDEDLLSHIKTEVSGTELQISYRSWLDFIMLPKSVKIYATLKDVHGVKISGAGSLHADSIKTDHLRLGTSGSSKMVIGILEAENLAMNVSGSCDCNISGRVDSQDVRVSGSGNYKASDLESQKAKVHVSGSCRVTLKVQQMLDINVSGSADISYTGSPKVQQRVTGSASIRQAVLES